MKHVDLTITEDYVGHWSYWQGARELLQNAIDTKDFTISFGRETIEIVSRGGSIPTSALLLGKTTKRDDNEAIGQYGEGMKLGFLVLLREGARITVRNGFDLWTPEITKSEIFDANILRINIEEEKFDEDPDVVEIFISDIPSWAVDEIRKNYAPETERTVVEDTIYGKAYEKLDLTDDEYDNENVDQDYTCNLFVNGLFVTQIVDDSRKFRFDYDFKASSFELDRDRDSASAFDVAYQAGRVWGQSDKLEMIAGLINEGYADLEFFDGLKSKTQGQHSYFYSRGGGSQEEDLRTTTTKMFTNKHGTDAFPINGDWSSTRQRVATEIAIKKGYVPTVVKNSVYKIIQSDFNVDKQVEKMLEFKPLDFLEGFLKKHDRHLYAKARRELQAVIDKLRIVEGK